MNFHTMLQTADEWIRSLATIQQATLEFFLVSTLGGALLALLVYMLVVYFNQPKQATVPLTKEERKAERKANRDQLKALLVSRNFNAAAWAIDEGLRCAVFEKRMSKSEANRWRVKCAEAFGMITLLPYHKRYRFQKLHPIKNALLKMDLKSRIEKLKKEKPRKIYNPAQVKFNNERRQIRIAQKHNSSSIAA